MKRILFGLLLVTCLSASAKTCYVNSVSGNDASSGDSPGNSWKSLTASIGRLSAGDTLYCSGSWSITSQFTVNTANITVRSNGAATVTITPVSPAGTLIFNGANTSFRGFTLLSTEIPSAPVQTLITFNGDSSTMADCIVRDFARQNVDDEIIIMISANGVTITNVGFYNILDRDIFRAWGVGNRWISCTFSNCNNPSAGTGGDPHADIIQTWWTGALIWSNVVERCYFVNSEQATFQLKGTPDNINCNPGREGYWTIRNNIFNNCEAWPVISTDQFRFYNNLLYKSGTGQYPLFIIQGPCLNGARYFNNVLVESYCETGSNPSYGYNAFTAAGSSFGGTGDFATTEAACKFVNAAAGNFRLQAGSSLIGKGINLSTDANMTNIDADGNVRPSTGAWDIGPYQYGAGTGNQSPVVSAGNDLNLYLPTNSVTLAGSAADPEGTTLSLNWLRVSGPATMAFASPGSAVTTATFPTNLGTYVLRLTASDGTNSVSDDVNVTINAPLVAPVASFQAESGVITAPFAISSGAISQSVETDLAEGGRAVYQFTVPANGTYTISALVNAPSTSSDSFFLNIDGEPIDPYMIWDVSPPTSGFETRLVTWRGNGTPGANEFEPKVFTLSAGQHALIVVGRESGAALDRFDIRSMSVVPSPSPPANLRLVSESGL